MAYTGQQVAIPFGQMALRTDGPMTSLPPQAAITANNVTVVNSRLEKSSGSRKYNSSGMDGAVVCLKDWFPTPSLQRLIALTSTGKCYRDTGDGTFTSMVPIATGLGTLTPDVHMCEGGAEDAGNNKKLFIFTGSSQVKRITGDGSTLASISNPAADWASNFPTFGLPFAGRLAAFGNSNNRHTLYLSKTDNHEVFDGSASECPQFPVFPGEGDGLISGTVYKGRLFLFKRPQGVYYVEQNGSADPADWQINKLSDAFGLASPHSIAQVLDDLWAGNATGSITSLLATNSFGDLKAGDVLTNFEVEDYVKEQFDDSGISKSQAVYYNEKKKALFTAKSSPVADQDRILVIDIAKQMPRISIETKDQPTCLALRRDSNGIERPIYGDNEGFVFFMEDTSYSVDGDAYLGEFQTPFMDFSFIDPTLSTKNKLFDFFEIQYISTGNYSFYVDVYIDNRFVETLNFGQFQGAALDSFVLDTDTLGVMNTISARKPLHGAGKRISFRFYNGLANEYFKLEKFIVSFRLGAEQQRGSSGFSV